MVGLAAVGISVVNKVHHLLLEVQNIGKWNVVWHPIGSWRNKDRFSVTITSTHFRCWMKGNCHHTRCFSIGWTSKRAANTSQYLRSTELLVARINICAKKQIWENYICLYKNGAQYTGVKRWTKKVYVEWVVPRVYTHLYNRARENYTRYPSNLYIFFDFGAHLYGMRLFRE